MHFKFSKLFFLVIFNEYNPKHSLIEVRKGNDLMTAMIKYPVSALFCVKFVLNGTVIG